jgi:3-hydroxyisobutyrate dehydrogenase-like beta-hydroxyacid dehydrogenase
MGGAIARSLIAGGYQVHGFDIRPDRRDTLAVDGGTAAQSARDIADRCEVVLLSLPSDEALLAVAEELAIGVGKGSMVAELSTLSLAAKEQARRIVEPAGAVMLDCPLSGTAIQARNRDLVVLASGDPDACARLGPVFLTFGRAVHQLGSFGKGTLTKLVANHLVATHIACAAEALVLARRAGLDLITTLDAVADGAGGSRMLEVRGPLMVRGEFQEPWMPVSLFQKDLGLIQDLAATTGAPVPMLEAATRLYASALAEGRGAQDTASIFATLDGSRGEVRVG